MTPPTSPRRGLAIAALIMGAAATVMFVAALLIGRASDGQGLSNASLLVILFYYVAPVVGLVAIVIGIIGAIRLPSKVLSVVGIVLGAVPVVWIIVQTMTGFQLAAG